VREAACPFCAAKLPKLVARRLEIPRMSRAAVVAAVVAATGCRDKTPEVTADLPAKTLSGDAGEESPGLTDPVQNAIVDAAGDAEDADADDAVHLHHPPVAKYGAPPHPHPISHPKYGAPPPPDPF
jgi:hypothetical protein